MKKSIALLVIISCFAADPARGSAPESARTLVNAAVAGAHESGKAVLIVFRASWCGWCKRLENALESSGIRKIIDEHFVVVKLNVFERGDKVQTIENPGARTIVAEYGGEKSGLPFLVFLDAKGSMIANSNVMPDNQNIGYPGSEEEIAAFLKLLKKAAPQMSGAQEAAISDYLTRNAPR
jgi:thioredoxin-related protein